jgi:hypothetical protein
MQRFNAFYAQNHFAFIDFFASGGKESSGKDFGMILAKRNGMKPDTLVQTLKERVKWQHWKHHNMA